MTLSSARRNPSPALMYRPKEVRKLSILSNELSAEDRTLKPDMSHLTVQVEFQPSAW
jgi:hypothetical protein